MLSRAAFCFSTRVECSWLGLAQVAIGPQLELAAFLPALAGQASHLYHDALEFSFFLKAVWRKINKGDFHVLACADIRLDRPSSTEDGGLFTSGPGCCDPSSLVQRLPLRWQSQPRNSASLESAIPSRLLPRPG